MKRILELRKSKAEVVYKVQMNPFMMVKIENGPSRGEFNLYSEWIDITDWTDYESAVNIIKSDDFKLELLTEER